MKYDIIKDFKGSPDGHTVIQYIMGKEGVELEDELAKVALEEKWVKPSKLDKEEAKAKAEAEAKAKAEAEAKAKAEAEAKAKAEAEAKAEAIAKLKAELAQLEDDAKSALGKDKSGKTAEPIKKQWEEKKAELEALLA